MLYTKLNLAIPGDTLNKEIKMNQHGSVELHQYVVKKVLLFMTTKYSRVWPNNTGMIKTEDRVVRFGLKGSSDVIGLYKGIFLGIEVKTGNAHQNEFQINFEKMIRLHGGIYVLIKETNVEQVLNIVEQKFQELK